MSERVTLEPCPFCGGVPEIVTRDVEPQGDPYYGRKDEQFIECKACGCTLFDRYFHEGFYDKADAVAAWNRRTTPPATQHRRDDAEGE